MTEWAGPEAIRPMPYGRKISHNGQAGWSASIIIMSEQEWQAEIFLTEMKSVSVTPCHEEMISVSMEMKVYMEMFRVIMAKNGKRNRKIKNQEKRGRNR